MRYGISISPAGPGGDPASMAELAAEAEQAGWDGIFLEDYIVYQGQDGTPTYDPWVNMAAMAVATSRLRLGTSVTPLPRRRPWKLASEAASLDRFDIALGGRERAADWDREREQIRSLADAGATWWSEWIQPGDRQRTIDAVRRGPLRVN